MRFTCALATVALFISGAQIAAVIDPVEAVVRFSVASTRHVAEEDGSDDSILHQVNLHKRMMQWTDRTNLNNYCTSVGQSTWDMCDAQHEA
jgi:hypothetical protein